MESPAARGRSGAPQKKAGDRDCPTRHCTLRATLKRASLAQGTASARSDRPHWRTTTLGSSFHHHASSNHQRPSRSTASPRSQRPSIAQEGTKRSRRASQPSAIKFDHERADFPN